jgi:hypothetical protein
MQVRIKGTFKLRVLRLSTLVGLFSAGGMNVNVKM